ncbi:MAG: prolipoprotein diacylglyceryl transferase [Ruminococcus sp.]|nr:prolipoprotein diacylglyceryl transferase [Ruminococcus sp.]MBQ7133313.1 prolipoprotein diacylglyceryl transferase [Ruminococcus sp.]
MFNVSFPGLGLEFTINRVAFSIGDFSIYWYAICIATGVVLALVYAYFNAKRFNVDVDKLVNCFIVGVITAILGARIYYVAFKWDYFSNNLDQILNIRDGGIAIYGAIIGALLGGLIVAKIQKMELLPVLDLTMICFLIGQAVGRWGNFMNQEAYGSETDSLFRMVSEGTGGVAVHPCFLYESVWCALGVLALHIFSKKWQKYYGQITFLYMVWYGFERMIVEGLRTDSLYLPFAICGYQIRVSQILSAVIVIAGIVLLIVFRNKNNFKREIKEEVIQEAENV